MKKELRKLVEETIKKIASKESEPEIKQRARKFIEEVIGVDKI